MSTVTMGRATRIEAYDPEDVRVGRTLDALMYRNEETPTGAIIRRRITQDELAQNIRLNGREGVSRSYIAQVCNGAKHLNNALLYAISDYLNINPIIIKRPDLAADVVAA